MFSNGLKPPNRSSLHLLFPGLPGWYLFGPLSIFTDFTIATGDWDTPRLLYLPNYATHLLQSFVVVVVVVVVVGRPIFRGYLSFREGIGTFLPHHHALV